MMVVQINNNQAAISHKRSASEQIIRPYCFLVIVITLLPVPVRIYFIQAYRFLVVFMAFFTVPVLIDAQLFKFLAF